MTEPPRWLDCAAAAAYCSLTEAGFRRRVRSGVSPKPSRAAGEASPRGTGWPWMEIRRPRPGAGCGRDLQKGLR